MVRPHEPTTTTFEPERRPFVAGCISLALLVGVTGMAIFKTLIDLRAA